MDFETDKLLAKISGENVENFASCVVDDGVKAQIDFAFNQMFQGLTLLQWMKKNTLIEAWQNSLNKMIDFIFALSEKNYVTDYLHVAVFDYKKNTLKNLQNSVHAYEYFNCPVDKKDELKQSADEKIKQAIDIIMNLVSNPKKCGVEKIKTVEKEKVYQNIKIREREQERERERK